MRSRCSRQIALAIAALGLSSSFTNLHAAAITWTGLAGSGAWSDGNNWNPTNPPGATDEAYFNNSGNGQTTVSPGGAQSAGSIEFDTNAAAYTIGASTDTLTLSGGAGAVALTSGNTAAQAVNSGLSLSNAAPSILNNSAAVLTLGSSSSPATINASPTSLTFGVTNGATIVVNDAIAGSFGSLTVNNTGTLSGNVGTVVLNSSQSTYTGATNLTNGTGTVTLELGASTDSSSNASFTEGPLGKSTLEFNSTDNTPIIAVGGDQTIANSITMTFGFTINNAPTPHNLTFSGPISYNAGGKTVTINTPSQTFSLGTTASPSTITLSNSAGSLNLDTTAGSTLVINDTMVDFSGTEPGVVAYNSVGGNTAEGTVLITGQNTYSGGTKFNASASGGPLTVEIGSSSNGAGTSGPFGSGAITFADGNAPPIMEAYGADRTVANPLTFTNGMFAGAPPTSLDSTSPHNLTFTGTVASFGKTMTNNIPAGAALFFGASPTTPTTFTITSGATLQSQSGAGITVFNDTLAGTAGWTLKSGGTVYINNAANTYSGALAVLGNGTAGVGNNGVGTGATLAGTGKLGGTVTIGSATAGSVGGIVSPGGDGNTLTGPGTLNLANMTWNPYGQYVYQYSATDNSSSDGANDLLSGSGGLTMSALSSSAKFDLDLVDLGTGNVNGPYTLATFATGITGASANQDVTSDFSYSGVIPQSVVVSSDGKSLLVNFAATPEPGSLSLLSIAGLGLIRRRRR